MADSGQLERYQGEATIEKVASLSRRRGFVFPTSDIYGGLGSSFDFGHYGVLLAQNIKEAWQRSMIQERDDMVALDSAVILNPQVWVASGYVGGFSDPKVNAEITRISTLPSIDDQATAWADLDASLAKRSVFIGLAQRRALYIYGSGVSGLKANEAMGGLVDLAKIGVK